METPVLIVATLSNNDVALFVNGLAIISSEEEESNPSVVGADLAEAMGVQIVDVFVDTPANDDWDWSDIYALIPAEKKVGILQSSNPPSIQPVS